MGSPEVVVARRKCVAALPPAPGSEGRGTGTRRQRSGCRRSLALHHPALRAEDGFLAEDLAGPLLDPQGGLHVVAAVIHQQTLDLLLPAVAIRLGLRANAGAQQAGGPGLP